MRTLSIIATFLFVGVLHAAEPNTPDELRGVWKLNKIQSMGQTVPPDKASYEFHITEKQFIWRFVGNTTGPDQVFDCFPIESDGVAKIDFRSAGKELDSEGKPLHIRAIYKLEGDKLFICSKRDADMKPSQERPSEFVSTRELRSDLMELERVPESPGEAGR